jgi:hypothetical protein
MTNPSIEKDGHLTQTVFNALGSIIRQPPSGSTDSQRLSLVVVRTTSRKDYEVLFFDDSSLTLAYPPLCRCSS